jgi:DNA-binding MarR family transcriptional regulator
MGLFDWIRDLTGKKKDKELVIEHVDNQEPVKAYPSETVFEQSTTEPTPVESVEHQNHDKTHQNTTFKPVDEHQTFSTENFRQLNKQMQTVESIDQHQPPFIEEPKRVSIDEQSTHLAIKQWEDTIKIAQQHPLSQVKIINSKILEDLDVVLKSMNQRLERLDDLDKLDIILELLQSTKQEIESKGIRSDALDNAISQIGQFTIKDKDVIEWVARQERVTAQQLADFLNLSRSTASFRLNRLSELNALEKEAIGKKIYYKLKKTGESNAQ